MFRKRDNIQNLNTRQCHKIYRCQERQESFNLLDMKQEQSTKGFETISRNSPVGKFPPFFHPFKKKVLTLWKTGGNFSHLIKKDANIIFT